MDMKEKPFIKDWMKYEMIMTNIIYHWKQVMLWKCELREKFITLPFRSNKLKKKIIYIVIINWNTQTGQLDQGIWFNSSLMLYK